MTTALTPEQIAELERAEKEATPAPWQERVETHESTMFGGKTQLVQIRSGKTEVLRCLAGPDDLDPANDSRFVSRLRNAAPALLQAAKERDGLRELFESLACITEDTAECPFCNYDGDGGSPENEGETHSVDCPLAKMIERFGGR